ncbi:MAG: FtsX-like permease family protein [Xanthobacteraceae bacterium]
MRFAWRDLRGGVRGFGVFIACIALGVMAIAGVGSLAASLAGGIEGAGQVILGGDLAFALVERQASEAERTFLGARGAVSVAATMRAMARTSGGATTLVEVKAVDAAYPLFGKVLTDPAMPLPDLFAQKDGAFGAAADPALLARLGLKPGDRISLGNAAIALRAALVNEPDKLSGGFGFGPRLLISQAALRASGLVAPGSVVHWLYRLRLSAAGASDGAVAAVEQQAKTQLPDAGWEIRTRKRASPQLERSVERFLEFLTLVALSILIVGGVGVANAVTAHLARKRDSIATMKALGASGGDIFAVYCLEITLVALFAATIGAAIGAALPFAISHWLDAVIPLPVAPSMHPAVLALSIGYGVLIALAFALWPLGRAHDVSASMLFRDQVAAERRRPRPRYLFAIILLAAALAAVTIAISDNHRIAAIFITCAAGIALLLRLLALLVMRIAGRLPRWRSPVLRLAIANIRRPGALTPSAMLSLGLGLALLTTVIEIDGNLHREFTAALPAKAPSFFFLDIPAAAAERFDAFVRAHARGSTLERVPMLRGRIIAASGVKADDLKPRAGSRWVLRGDRGITYSATMPAGSRLVAGRWWGASYAGEPLVSLEDKTARDLGLKIGDTITVNVLGRELSARIANLRAVDWENLGINFILVFSPGSFAGAPHADIATLTFADGGTTTEETALVKAVGGAFPTITAIGVKDVLDALAAVVSKLVLALRAASALTLVAAALVLGGGLAAGQRSRIYDTVVLKALGATRQHLLAACVVEYCLIGLAAGLVGLGIGLLAADLIVSRMMELAFILTVWPPAAAALIALFVTVALGLAGTVAALGRKPAEVLRNL